MILMHFFFSPCFIGQTHLSPLSFTRPLSLKQEMKTLFLLRHAKSSWEQPALTDLERPLNKRGLKDAPRMGQWLKNNIHKPDLTFCSPSVRTLSTLKLLGRPLGLPDNSYQQAQALYHASPEVLMQFVKGCPDEAKSLLLVGHNPGLTEFANQLCPEQHITNIPTCGIFAVRLLCKSWRQARPTNSSFFFFQYPKNLASK